MARNDIRFAQANQADFGQANQMYLQSMNALNNAVAGLQDTTKTFGEAVTKKNTAIAKDMVNQLSLEDWNNPEKRADLEARLTAFNQSVGNALDTTQLVDHKQGNYQRLLEDSNAYFKNRQNQHIDFKEGLAVDALKREEAVQNAFGDVYILDQALQKLPKDSPEYTALASQKRSLMDSLDGRTKYAVDNLRLTRATDLLKAQTGHNTAKETHAMSKLLPIQEALKYSGRQVAQLENLLNNPNLSEENRQDILTELDLHKTNIIKWSEQVGHPYGGMNSANTAQQSFYKDVILPEQTLRQKALQDHRNYKLLLAQKQDESDRAWENIRIQRTNAETSRMIAETSAHNAARQNAKDIAEEERRSTQHTAKFATFLGNNWQNPDGTLAPSTLNRVMQTLSSLGKKSEQLTDDITDDEYTEFLTKHVTNKGQLPDLKKVLDEYTYQGRKLTNGEKRLIFLEFGGDIPYFDSSKKSEIEKIIARRVPVRELQIQAEQHRHVQNVLSSLVNAGYSPEQIISQLRITASSPITPYLPSEFQALLDKSNQAQRVTQATQPATSSSSKPNVTTSTGQYRLPLLSR